MKALHVKLTSTTSLFLMLFLISSCRSPQKMVESGDYDRAIEYAVQKLEGKSKKKEKFVHALEEGFRKATRRDMRDIAALKNDGAAHSWQKIYSIYRDIELRQELVEPLLPLIGKAGYHATFKFVKVDEPIKEAKHRSSEYYYSKGEDYLKDARLGDKNAARKAYNAFNKINQFYPDFRNKEKLTLEARHLGTTRYLFKMANDARVTLPTSFEQELLRISVRDMNSVWNEFDMKPVEGVIYDYDILMRLTNIEVSPEILKERAYVDHKEIEDGFEYVLDNNGNVLKDTSGNDVTVPRKVFIYANVIEVYQNKFARVGGRLEVFDRDNKSLIDTRPITVETIFENYASTFTGDRRALSRDSKNRLGNSPQPFPHDDDLLLEAAERLKPIVKEEASRFLLL